MIMLDIKTEVNGSEVIIYVDGRLDTVTSPQLMEEIEKIIPSADKIILDIEKIEYVSSAGLRVFLAADNNMRKKDGELNMRNVPGSVMDVFEMTGFSNALNILE